MLDLDAFYQHVCVISLIVIGVSLVVVVGVCVPGGSAGDGHPVGAGQQTAGEVQDAGRHR